MLLIRDSCSSNILSLFLLLLPEDHVLLDCTGSYVHMAAAEGSWLEPDLSYLGTVWLWRARRFTCPAHGVAQVTVCPWPGFVPCAMPTTDLLFSAWSLLKQLFGAPKQSRRPHEKYSHSVLISCLQWRLGCASKPVFNPITLPHWFWIILV